MIAILCRFSALALLWLVVTNCQTAPANPFAAGQRELARGELVAALRSFDAVPVSDPNYPQARLRAAALEFRLQRHKEKLLRGLKLRAQWRDQQALTEFSGALAEWPEHVETRELIATTKGRLKLMQTTGSTPEMVWVDPPAHGAASARGGALSSRGDGRIVDQTLPVASIASEFEEEPAPVAVAQQPAVGGAESSPGVGSVGAALPEGSGEAAVESVVGAARSRKVERDDLVTQALTRIAAESAAGRMEDVFEALEVLQRSWPDDPRVASRLARMLHQRGLMSYGNGDLAAAVADWRRALQLDPGLRAVRALFDAAAAELAAETAERGNEPGELPAGVTPMPNRQ
ncbi:MAG: hypothetical protein VYE77_09190 [Planctomycetota bacterium]|nr:hypothetical protein [Planctomycetota bacterium]